MDKMEKIKITVHVLFYRIFDYYFT